MTTTTTPNVAIDVLRFVGPHANILAPIAFGEPRTLVDTLEEHAAELDHVRIHQMDPFVQRRYIRGEFGDHLRHVSYYLGPGSRQAYWDGQVELVPNHFSEVPMILRQVVHPSVVIAAANGPDQHGYFSLGTNADYVASFIGEVPFFLEVTDTQPFTYGQNHIHISKVAGWINTDAPLPAVHKRPSDPRDKAIAQFIAAMIPDGGCLQVGVGAIPDALLSELADHTDLGVHTECFSEGLMTLVERGAVTGARKHHHRNKHVATFSVGSPELMHWLDHNAAVEMLPVEWTNDPRVVAQEPNFMSINATTEVDLMGQAASETIAGKYWSSSGGQADFARGAMYSPGGKAFLVLHSTTSSGRGRIRTELTAGSVVTTLKNTVDHIVTEYGVAALRGASISERAQRLIAIAHPDHRDELRFEASKTGLLHRQRDTSGKKDHAMTGYDVYKHPSRRLADFVAATPKEVVPAEVVTRLRRLVLDWIGITAFAGHHAENADAVRAVADKLDAGAGATVVGQAHTHSPLYAALLNGCFAHSMDFDDTNIIQAGHPGAPVIAAALADAERIGVDMAAFYDAVAFGYEVACRVGAALGPSAYDRGFHITAVAGIFGAVAASAQLRGLDAEVTDSAFGLALSKAAGSMQYLANGSWNKRLHPGFAAHDGLLCVELAQAGVIGAAEALEGRYGLLHSYTDDAQPGQLTDELTTRWMLLQTAIKPYPSCRWTHGAIDAALALRPQVPAEQRPDAHISVWLSPTAYPIVGEPQPHKLKPANTVDAQFSVYFQFAAAWLDGHVDWATYRRLTDPDIAALAAHINVQQDERLPRNGSTVIIDAGGETLCTTIDLPLGEPANWISDDRLRDKFDRHAGSVYGIEQSTSIAATVLDESPGIPVRELAARLRLHKGHNGAGAESS